MNVIVTDKLIDTMVTIMAVKNGIPTGKFFVHGEFNPSEEIFGLDTKRSTSTVRIFDLYMLTKDIVPYSGQLKEAIENSTVNVKKILINVFSGCTLNECIDILINAELSDPVKDRLINYVVNHKNDLMMAQLDDKLGKLLCR